MTGAGNLRWIPIPHGHTVVYHNSENRGSFRIMIPPGDFNVTPPYSEAVSISGTIEFHDVRAPAFKVTVYVRVQDTSRSDASASTVAEQVLRDVNIIPGAPPLPFNIGGIPQNPKARYVVRIHADVDGDGVVSRGDYVSTQSYPVEISEKPVSVSILARQVG
jgi:uncharacterized lipoprotein YbaY